MQNFEAFRAVSIPINWLVAVPAKATHNLLALAALRDGWMRGSGKRISRSVIEASASVTAKLQGYDPKAIEHFPDVNGGLVVSGIFNGYIIDVLCRPDGLYDCSFQRDGVDDSDREAVALVDMLRFVQEKTCPRQDLYSFSILANTAKNYADTRAWRLRTPPVVGFPFSSQIAQSLRQAVFAST